MTSAHFSPPRRGFAAGFARALLMGMGTLLVAAGAGAQAENGTPGAARIDAIHNSDTLAEIAADGRVTHTVDRATRILGERVLEEWKTASVTYSRGIQEAEIVAAWTQKTDGRRIDAPKDNYQTNTRSGRAGGNPFFSDYETITVVFPDLEVGDTAHFKYRLRDNEPIYPGHASLHFSHSPFVAMEEARISVRAPRGLRLAVESHHLEELAATEEDGFVVRQWRYRNPRPRAWNAALDTGIWKVGDAPELFVSTFRSYEELAAVYGERALPKAAPTARIRALAAEIVGAEKDRREQARLLYEWVSTQLHYAGNCIGIGAVVPRDMDVVLDNKLGDCKDHATLLQALLAARDIASEQVLIHSGNRYDLPAIPLVEAVDHVLNHLPEWRMYVDATVADLPFGHLPRPAYGKPVIHVGAANAVRRLESGGILQERLHIHNKLKFSAGGSVSGEAKISIQGDMAARVRKLLADMKPEQREKYIENALRRMSLRGKGTLEPGEFPADERLSDKFEYGLTFTIDKFLRQHRGAFTLAPLFANDFSIASRANTGNDVEFHRTHPCGNGAVSEVYDIVLEPGIRFTQLPEPLTHDTPYLDFKSTIEPTRNGLRIERIYVDKTIPGVCEAAFGNAWNKEAVFISENLDQQIFYQRDEK
jgi:hypothetical protein